VTRYRDAGVDVAGADAVKARIAERVRATWGPGVRPIPRGFAGAIAWPGGGPLLAATMDGVGTKLHVALAAGRVDDATADLVYHCANDLLVHGATPLCFLDYIAQARLASSVVSAAIEGMARACAEVGAALLGGETAQMPDTYLPEVVDVAGCMIGWVPADRVLDGARVVPGDVVLGLGSDGLHTNGYSLARRVLAESGLGLEDRLPGGDGSSIADALLAAHRWYGPALAPQLADPAIHAVAHVTGGGIAGNLVRVLPDGCRAVLDVTAWPRPAVFEWIARAGAVPEPDLRETFNLGIGMMVVAAADSAAVLMHSLAAAGERLWRIGHIEAGARGVVWRDGEAAAP
jgi:phosphoribosylformylglycinamidine cyclo-ligase